MSSSYSPLVRRQRSDNSSVQTERLLGRQMPASVEAERSVLSTLLMQDDRWAGVSALIQAADFYVPAHQHIFQAMHQIVESKRRIDLVTLQNTLSALGKLEAVGGVVALLTLQEELPLIHLAEQHAAIIKEKALLRELIGSAAHIISTCYDAPESGVDSVIDAAEKTIFKITAQRTPQSFVQLNIWLKRTFQHLSDIKGNARGVTGVSSGYKRLDDMTSGFQKGDLIVLAARPSMGKTALALSFAYQAVSQGGVVGFFSLEMAAEQLTLRLLSAASGVAHHLIRNATISSDQWVELTYVAARLAEHRLFIDDTAMQTIMDIRTKARKLKTEHNLSMLVIDYLQLLSSNKSHENRHQEVSEISRALKGLAKELSIPIIALSQLSRAVDSRLDKRPLLSDLRESGAIEQDADVIMFLYRDSVYNQDSDDPHLAELIIGKQRNGPTGTVNFTFHRELTAFEERDE